MAQFSERKKEVGKIEKKENYRNNKRKEKQWHILAERKKEQEREKK